MPGSESVGIGTYYMTNKICAYTRSILESGIENGFNYLDVLLYSETCQMMHRGHEHSEILNPVKENTPRVFMRMTDAPFTVGGAAAEHYEDQIKTRILEPLNKTCGVDISEDAIKAAIEDHNGIYEISEIGDMSELPEPPISGYEFHVIQLVSEVCSHYLIKDKLRETLRELKNGVAEKMAGGNRADRLGNGRPGVHKAARGLRSHGGRHRYCFGSLPGREQIVITEGETALRAVARHYIETSQCPRFMDKPDSNGRKEYVKKLAEEYGADGIVYLRRRESRSRKNRRKAFRNNGKSLREKTTASPRLATEP